MAKCAAAACASLVLAAASAEAAGVARQTVTVDCGDSCEAVVRILRRMGGDVSPADKGRVAVSIATERLPEIPMLRGVRTASKQPQIAQPAPARVIASGKAVALETGRPRLIRTAGAADQVEMTVAEVAPATAAGKVAQNELIPVLVNVPAGTRELSFVLAWDEEPVDDVDLIVLAPDGSAEVTGATLRNPERAVVANPTPGVWTAFVNGFAMNGRADRWQLGVTADGVSLSSR